MGGRQFQRPAGWRGTGAGERGGDAVRRGLQRGRIDHFVRRRNLCLHQPVRGRLQRGLRAARRLSVHAGERGRRRDGQRCGPGDGPRGGRRLGGRADQFHRGCGLLQSRQREPEALQVVRLGRQLGRRADQRLLSHDPEHGHDGLGGRGVERCAAPGGVLRSGQRADRPAAGRGGRAIRGNGVGRLRRGFLCQQPGHGQLVGKLERAGRQRRGGERQRAGARGGRHQCAGFRRIVGGQRPCHPHQCAGDVVRPDLYERDAELLLPPAELGFDRHDDVLRVDQPFCRPIESGLHGTGPDHQRRGLQQFHLRRHSVHGQQSGAAGARGAELRRKRPDQL